MVKRLAAVMKGGGWCLRVGERTQTTVPALYAASSRPDDRVDHLVSWSASMSTISWLSTWIITCETSSCTRECPPAFQTRESRTSGRDVAPCVLRVTNSGIAALCRREAISAWTNREKESRSAPGSQRHPSLTASCQCRRFRPS